MKNFLLDENGDVVIRDNQIQMVYDKELEMQTVRQVVGTKLGEWFKNKEEGMDFSVLLVKNPNWDLIRDAINTAIKQVDEDFEIIDFEYEMVGRKVNITFTYGSGSASDSNPVTIII